jgi:hypothetical protein
VTHNRALSIAQGWIFEPDRIVGSLLAWFRALVAVALLGCSVVVFGSTLSQPGLRCSRTQPDTGRPYLAELSDALLAKGVVLHKAVKPETYFAALNLLGGLPGKRDVFEGDRHVVFFGGCPHDPIQSKFLRLFRSRVIRERWHLSCIGNGMEPQSKVSNSGNTLAMIFYPYLSHRYFQSAPSVRTLVGNFIERKANRFQDPSSLGSNQMAGLLKGGPGTFLGCFRRLSRVMGLDAYSEQCQDNRYRGNPSGHHGAMWSSFRCSWLE